MSMRTRLVAFVATLGLIGIIAAAASFAAAAALPHRSMDRHTVLAGYLNQEPGF
jgi:hypothetical protein